MKKHLRLLSAAFGLCTLTNCAFIGSESNDDPASVKRREMIQNPYLSVITEWHGKVFVIGDLHGDLNAARRTLQIAGAIDSSDRWVGQDLIVVQVGDQIDRGDNDREVLDLLDRLTLEAVNHGSRLIVLNGNHEVMNVDLDLRYVSFPSFRAFRHFALPSLELPLDRLKLDPAKGLNATDKMVRQRAHAFLPGGDYARLLAKRSFYAIVNDTFFVHGGVTCYFRNSFRRKRSGRGYLDQILAFDHELKEWMLGQTTKIPEEVNPSNTDESPLWSRYYSDEKESDGTPLQRGRVCAIAEEFLNDMHLRRMVVGHTIQTSGINSICEGRIWRVDIGLSGAFGRYPQPQVLELSNGIGHIRM